MSFRLHGRDIIRQFSKQLSSEQHGFIWVGCSSIFHCSISTVMTGGAGLVGVLRVRCWAKANMSGHYALMSPDSSHEL